MNESDLKNDPAFQVLGRAGGFLEAARIVVANEGNKTVLRAPVGFLIAHGLELLMKHVLAACGMDIDAVKKKFGHDLTSLWRADEMEGFRTAALRRVKAVWDDASNSGLYKDEFSDDPVKAFKEHLEAFSLLHSAASGHGLRYPSSQYDFSPVPLFFLDIFQPLKDALARYYSRYLGEGGKYEFQG